MNSRSHFNKKYAIFAYHHGPSYWLWAIDFSKALKIMPFCLIIVDAQLIEIFSMCPDICWHWQISRIVKGDGQSIKQKVKLELEYLSVIPNYNQGFYSRQKKRKQIRKLNFQVSHNRLDHHYKLMAPRFFAQYFLQFMKNEQSRLLFELGDSRYEDQQIQVGSIDLYDAESQINPEILEGSLDGISIEVADEPQTEHSVRKVPKKERAPSAKSKKVTKSSKKQKSVSKVKSDYVKNICGYIFKKAIQETSNQLLRYKVEQLCTQYSCDYEKFVKTYSTKIQSVTGPTHIPGLFQLKCQGQDNLPRVFMQFCLWYLKSHYLHYLMGQGKMEQKKQYIRYKNRRLIPQLERLRQELFMAEEKETSFMESKITVGAFE